MLLRFFVCAVILAAMLGTLLSSFSRKKNLNSSFSGVRDPKGKGAPLPTRSGHEPASAPVKNGEPLAASACRVEITAAVPNAFKAGEQTVVTCTVKNVGSAVLASEAPYPVLASYKWLEGDNLLPIEGERTLLLPALKPQESQRITVNVWPPARSGSYKLRLTLVQEHVAWFDTITPGNALDLDVRVTS
jgi:hypothetical protein